MKRNLLPVARALKRNLPSEAWESVTDPRDPRGVRYLLATMLQILTLGLVTAQRTLRDVERLTRNLAARRALNIRGTPSDTALYNLIRQLDPAALRPAVVAQVSGMARNKQLEAAIDFPWSLVAVDGKALGTDEERLHPESHRQRTGDEARYVLKAVRAVHVSSAVKPILDQQTIPAGKGERHGLWDFLQRLRQDYGVLVGCLSFDAGFWSQDLAMRLSVTFRHYIFALKGNAGSAYSFACNALGSEDQDPPGGWEIETREKQGQKVVLRQLARIDHDLGTYSAVRGAWRQRTRVFVAGKLHTQDDRYFATSLSSAHVTAAQALAGIRAHWGIENDSNWTMDVVLNEDTHTWVAQGRGREVLCWLRILAYNLIRLIRCRTLRAEKRKLLPWRAVLEEVRDTLLRPDLWDPTGFS